MEKEAAWFLKESDYENGDKIVNCKLYEANLLIKLTIRQTIMLPRQLSIVIHVENQRLESAEGTGLVTRIKMNFYLNTFNVQLRHRSIVNS